MAIVCLIKLLTSSYHAGLPMFWWRPAHLPCSRGPRTFACVSRSQFARRWRRHVIPAIGSGLRVAGKRKYADLWQRDSGLAGIAPFRHGAVDLVGTAARYTQKAWHCVPMIICKMTSSISRLRGGVQSASVWSIHCRHVARGFVASACEPCAKGSHPCRLACLGRYMVMGRSNAMFEIATQTMVYGAVLSIVAHLAWTPNAPGARPGL
jgi:hypothetical protein